MIKFYTTKECLNCRECQDICEALSEMSLAHEVVLVSDKLPKQIEDHPISSLPAIIEGRKTAAGLPAVKQHIKEIRKFKADWDRFQSDSCYCGDDGEVI